jgi:hypothetical protein
MRQERWRAVPSVPGLLASTLGRLMVVPHFEPLPNGGLRQYGGQPTFGQLADGRFIYLVNGATHKVHRLVCEAFNGPCPPGMVCMHKDENAKNNRPSNLLWGTQRENLNAPGFLAYCRSRTGDRSPTVKARKAREMETN